MTRKIAANIFLRKNATRLLLGLALRSVLIRSHKKGTSCFADGNPPGCLGVESDEKDPFPLAWMFTELGGSASSLLVSIQVNNERFRSRLVSFSPQPLTSMHFTHFSTRFIARFLSSL